MENLDIVNRFIFDHPDVVARLLAAANVEVAKPLTLDRISVATFKTIFAGNQKFVEALDNAITHEGYLNFEPISLGVSAALSIGSSILGASQARKQRELMKAIALAQLSNQKYLGELDIRTQAETERIKILLQSLAQYQTDLQGQSTQRIKDSWLYVLGVAAGIGIIFGVYLLLAPNPKTAA